MNGIQKIRQRLGLTQDEFAAQLQVSQGAVSHWERGNATPTPAQARNVIAVAEQMGVFVTFNDVYLNDKEEASQ